MSETWVLVVPLLCVAVVGLAAAVGCEATIADYPHMAFMVLRYDPTVVVDGKPIVIERVVFRYEVSEVTEVSVDLNGTTTTDGRMRPADPLANADTVEGEFWYWGVAFLDTDETMKVTCDAFSRAGDGVPTYPMAGSPIEGVLRQDLEFPFRLVQQGSRWVVVADMGG